LLCKPHRERTLAARLWRLLEACVNTAPKEIDVKQNPLIWRLALGLSVATAACSTGTTDTGDGGGGGDNPTITVSLSASSLSVARGSNGTLTATIARAGGFTGAVAITIEGLPTGVTASANPASIAAGSTTSTITVTAGDNVTAGTSTVTVRASGSGVTAVTATFSLTLSVPAQGSYTLAISPTSLSIQAGSQNTATVNLTRTNFTGSIALAVSGAPTGVTATLNPTSTTANSSTLTVAVGAAVAAGNYTLTVTGTATGLTNQTATLTLTVTAVSGGGGNVTYTFCQSVGLPAWVAYQDGSGAWTVVTGTNNQYSFNIASGRGGVAWVKTNSSNGGDLFVYYGSQQELSAQGTGQCGSNPTAPTKTVNGSVANVGATETAYVSFNGASATAGPLFGNNFTLQNVVDGPGDLIAGRTSQTINGTSIVTTFNKGIIRRAINPADGSTLPVLDFNAEGFTPVTNNLTINGLAAGENAIISLNYFTSSGAFGLLYSEAFGASSGTRQYSGVPSANQQAGDLHLLSVSALNLAGGGATFRQLTATFKDAADKTVTLGPTLASLNVSTVAARLAFTYTIQSQYNQFWVIGGSQAAGTIAKTAVAYFSAGYVGSSTAFNYSFPDFTTLAGWNAAWSFVTGTQVNWYFNATGWNGTGGIFGAPNSEGVVSQTAVGTGTITP
jgi:hypothetical protein